MNLFFTKLLYCKTLCTLALIIGVSTAAGAPEQTASPARFSLEVSQEFGPLIGPAIIAASFPTTDPDGSPLRRIVADELSRGALLYLRKLDNPTQEDFHIAALTIEEALTLEPDDVELVRLWIEALYSANDEAGVQSATRRLIRLDPEDTVAQLRLISSRIKRMQTSEERQRAYDRLIDQGAGRLADSIRSRLALDDALLAQELGDEERFVRRLTLATQLDSTNKPAAVLAATYTLDRLDDPIARVEMLANVMIADPMDPATHLNLAGELFAHGAFACANRFYRNAQVAMSMQGQGPGEDLIMRLLLSSWSVDGAQSVIKALNGTEKAQLFMIKQQRIAAELAGEDPEQIPPYRPATPNETIRLAAGIAIGDVFEQREALDQLKKITADAIDSLRNPAALMPSTSDEAGRPAPAAIDPALIAANIMQWRLNLLWFRLWSGLELEQASKTIKSLAAQEAAGIIRPEAMQRFRGLLAAQQEDFVSARELLGPIADNDPKSRIGLGIAAKKAGDTKGELRHYASVALDTPGTLLGVWSRSRIETLLGSSIEPTPVAKSLSEYCTTISTEIDRMISEPRAVLHLEVDTLKKDLRAFDRLEVHVRIRNMSPIALGIGADAPISSNLLLSPRMTSNTEQVLEDINPEVISFNRRLRLKAGEEVDAVIWAGQGQAGAKNEQSFLSPMLLRWRLIENFTVSEDGEYGESPSSLTAGSGVARRPPIEAPKDGISSIPTQIRTAQGVRLLEILKITPGAISVVEQQSGADQARKFIKVIATAMYARLASMTPFQRAMMTKLAPTSTEDTAFAPIDEALRLDDNRLVRLLNLYARVTDADDPIFDLAISGDDPVVAAIATRLQQRILEKNEQAVADAAGKKK